MDPRQKESERFWQLKQHGSRTTWTKCRISPCGTSMRTCHDVATRPSCGPMPRDHTLMLMLLLFLLRRPGCLKMCNTMIDATWPVILVTCEATTNATSRSRLVSKQIHLQWNSWNWWDWSFAEHRVLKPKQNRFCYTANARTLTGKALLVFHSSNPEQRTPPRDQVSSFTASPPNLGDSVAADISCKPTQSVKGTLVPSNKCEAMCNTSEITSRYTSQTWYKHVLGNLEDIPMHHCI